MAKDGKNTYYHQNIVPQEFGLLGRLVVRGVKPVDYDDGRQLLQEAIRAHAANGEVHRLAQLVNYRDERHSDLGVSVDDMTVHRFRQEMQRSDAAVFGWASWMDAGTADAVIRRFLTFDQAHRAVIGAWEHGGRFHGGHVF